MTQKKLRGNSVAPQHDAWQAYTITFKVPVSTATPVFHTRLTIAAAQAAIEVDAVQLTTT
ncbi:MAG: hypothetical protein NT020_07755 [Chloroflexales bacterium]|nr:hypothetical protein [Chloroflexales bacterium]